jgi:drug/metabolite transporter superfamily protein YnfA
MGSLSGSPVLNFVLAAVAELPGYLLMAAWVDRCDRRPLVTCAAAVAAGATFGLCLPLHTALQVGMVCALCAWGGWKGAFKDCTDSIGLLLLSCATTAVLIHS